jgi:excisionase family DNA binding protein
VDLDELRTCRAAVVTVAQAASVFGVDARTVARAIENGELPSIHLGRRVLIPRLPLLAVLGVTVDGAVTEAPTSASATGSGTPPGVSSGPLLESSPCCRLVILRVILPPAKSGVSGC